MFSYFSAYSPLELRHLLYLGTNFCIVCHGSLSPGIGTIVTLISASLSFWKLWRWPDRNFLRCKKGWKSLGARSGLYGGWWLNSPPSWTPAGDVLTVEPCVATDLAQLTNFGWHYVLCIRKLSTDCTSHSAGPGIRASICNRCYHTTVSIWEVPLVHASCGVNHVHAIASCNKWFTSCGKLALWTPLIVLYCPTV